MPATARPGLPLFAGLTPEDGRPKGVPVKFILTATAQSIVVDLTLEEMANRIEFVQCAWIDNSQNAALLTLNIPGCEQDLKVKAGWQGVYPIYGGMPLQFPVSSPVAVDTVIKMILLNVPQPFYSWVTV